MALILLDEKSREKGEGLINIQNAGRWNYSAQASRQVSIFCLVSMF